MIHPSYKELIDKINNGVAEDEEPIVTSRYSIVLASSKRARQLTAGDVALVKYEKGKKPLSVAVQELYEGKVNIIPGSEGDVEELPEESVDAIAEEAAEELVDEIQDDFGAAEE
ncbi:MAG: DNA-directed RNA polymerase subunit omega [Lachnospiraceae bacterium]|nr:DNA-directed RNA polymerase subunit omega [Lachnospiraceae bacterium]